MSREATLAKIRSALAAAGSGPSVDFERCYQTEAKLTPPDRLALFIQRVEDYDARVIRSKPASLAQDIAEVLLSAGRKKIAVPSTIAQEWLDPRIEWIADRQLSYGALESVDGVLTGASVAVAESGTLVLRHGEQEGRRALTLLPDYHLCVLQAAQVVETLPECFAYLETVDARALTFISGPSATADIEMTRIKGVHGPRFLDVLLVT